MRYIKFRLTPKNGPMHGIEERIADHPTLERKAIHHLDVLEDGTAITLYELVGELEDPEDVVGHPDLLSYSLSTAGSSIFSYTHFVPDETTRSLLEIQSAHDIIVDFPVYYSENGDLNVSIIAELGTLNEATASLPDDVEVELQKVGDFVPEEGHLFYQLTDRQQEVVRAAVKLGYYRNPRQATYEDIADVVDLAPGTVGEHLRKIEEQVLAELVPDL